MPESDNKGKQRESVGLWELNDIHLKDYYVVCIEDGRVCYKRVVYRPDLPEFFWKDDLNDAQKKRAYDERLAESSGNEARLARGYQGRLLSQEIANNPNIDTVTSSGQEAQKRRGVGRDKTKAGKDKKEGKDKKKDEM